LKAKIEIVGCTVVFYNVICRIKASYVNVHFRWPLLDSCYVTKRDQVL